jgi:hypothetical protein
MEYFMAILTGHVPQSQLFLVPFDEDERPSARPRTKMTLHDHPQTTTMAYAAENKANDKTEEEEGESSESNDDLEKVQKQDKNLIKASKHAKQKLPLDQLS